MPGSKGVGLSRSTVSAACLLAHQWSLPRLAINKPTVSRRLSWRCVGAPAYGRRALGADAAARAPISLKLPRCANTFRHGVTESRSFEVSPLLRVSVANSPGASTRLPFSINERDSRTAAPADGGGPQRRKGRKDQMAFPASVAPLRSPGAARTSCSRIVSACLGGWCETSSFGRGRRRDPRPDRKVACRGRSSSTKRVLSPVGRQEESTESFHTSHLEHRSG